MRYFNILIATAALCLASCIENDLPYPVEKLYITSLEGEGFTSSIDGTNRIVTLTLDEKTDICNVKITGATHTESQTGTVTLSDELTGTFDLRSPMYVTLSLYQDYEWTIVAEQNIERLFSVAGQVGATKFDAKTRTVTAYVSKTTDLASVTVNTMKFGPADITTYSPTLEELSGSSFESMRFVDITYHGRTERWMLFVSQTDKSVELTQADAWSRVIWLYGEGIDGHPKGFRYRKDGDADWTEVPNVAVEGGSFTARLQAESLTKYHVKAYCDDEETDPVELSTEGLMQLPNCGFEDWSQPGNPILPFLSDAGGKPINQFWSTSNNGSTVISASRNLVTPAEDLAPGVAGKYSAELKSDYVVMKMAAGSIYTGEFGGIRSLSHGIVNFGRPFTLRPTAMRIWMKYNCGVITDASKEIGSLPIGTTLKEGDNDTGRIYIALGTWTKEKYGYGRNKEELFGTDDSPVSIDTRDVATFFNSAGPDIVAYGSMEFNTSVPNWTRQTITLNYLQGTDKVPTHIIVVCASSKLGDYFTGSRDSKMWVDDVELLYDYNF